MKQVGRVDGSSIRWRNEGEVSWPHGLVLHYRRLLEPTSLMWHVPLLHLRSVLCAFEAQIGT